MGSRKQENNEGISYDIAVVGLRLLLLPVGQLPPRGPSALCWGCCPHSAQSSDNNCTSVTTEHG